MVSLKLSNAKLGMSTDIGSGHVTLALYCVAKDTDGWVCIQRSMEQQIGLIARSLPGRIRKQCQERWHNHLNPDIQRDAWTTEEEHALNNAHRNKWVEIAKFLPRRHLNIVGMGYLHLCNFYLLSILLTYS
uniref:Uncharacterized protein n=1 Tax=Triticum urartu TaxID=4572 RepID=A0A8R7QP40_TRIUA